MDNKDKDNAEKMTDMISKLAASALKASGFFGWEPGLRMFYCDILLRLYFQGRFYEAVELIDFIFYLVGMYETGQVVAVAAAGESEENCKAFLDQYYKNIDLVEMYDTLKSIIGSDC